MCERWSCRETRPPCFYQFNFRAARSPQRRAMIRDKRGTLRGLGACARRAHPAPHLAATSPMARSLQGVGLSRPWALRALAPLRAGAWGNGTCSETALPFLADPCPTRQPSARSRTPLAIRTRVLVPRLSLLLAPFSPRALPTRQRVRQVLSRALRRGYALGRAPRVLLPRTCPARLPCGGSRGLPTLPPLSARARGHKRRGTCSQRPPVGRASAARPPTSAPATLAVLVELGSRVASRCRGAAALRLLLVVPRRGMFRPRLRLPHSAQLGGSPPARAPAGQSGGAPARAHLVCGVRPVPLPSRGVPAPRGVRGQRGPPPRCFGRVVGAQRAGGGQGAPAACPLRALSAPLSASAPPVPPAVPSPSWGAGAAAPPSLGALAARGLGGGLCRGSSSSFGSGRLRPSPGC